MRKPQHWFTQVRKRFFPSSHREITILHSSSPSDVTAIREAGAIAEDHYGSASSTPSSLKKQLTREDLAALKIQANFRGHLARRAFRALRSLVKLQALVRGVCVRRQAQIAMQCMHALVRLQVRVRARQLLSQCSDN